MIRTVRGSEKIISYPGPLLLVTKSEMMKFVSQRVSIYLFPSLCRALNLKFPQYIGGLAHDSTINKEMGFGSISQTIGVLTPIIFTPRAFLLIMDLRLVSLNIEMESTSFSPPALQSGYLFYSILGFFFLRETHFDSNFSETIVQGIPTLFSLF